VTATGTMVCEWLMSVAHNVFLERNGRDSVCLVGLPKARVDARLNFTPSKRNRHHDDKAAAFQLFFSLGT